MTYRKEEFPQVPAPGGSIPFSILIVFCFLCAHASQMRLVELVRTVLLDRVVDWHKAEIVGIGKAKRRGIAKSHEATAGAAGNGEATMTTSGEGKRVFSVWSLLAKAGHGDAHKCLKKASTVQFRSRPKIGGVTFGA